MASCGLPLPLARARRSTWVPTTTGFTLSIPQAHSGFVINNVGAATYWLTIKNNIYYHNTRYETLYDVDWEEGGYTGIEEEIDNLIDEGNKLGEVVSEVSGKLREIIKICDENDINHEKFIAIHYKMKKF